MSAKAPPTLAVSITERPAPDPAAQTLACLAAGSVTDHTTTARRNHLIEDEEEADENESDEDHTVRFDEWRRSFRKGPDDASALQRVQSVT